MEQRQKTLKQAARAAIYKTLRKKHQSRRKWLIGFESFGIMIVLVLATVLQTYFQIKPPSYSLDQSTYNLIGESRDDTSQYLTEDTKSQSFNFSVPKADEAGAKEHTGRNADAYSANLPKKASDGVSFTDTASNISMTLIPNFKTYNGKKVDGDHIVYLASGGAKLIYTLKYNGLKEDIIIPSFQGLSLEHEFELRLPSGVEAKLDEQGNIGIYSSDPTLYGNISFGSDDDRARIDKARENGEKTNLVANIPAPIVKDASGIEHTNKSQFVLGEKRQKQTVDNKTQTNIPAEVQQQMASKTTQNIYSLKIESMGLKDLPYPISIDPTFQISSAADFTGVNGETGSEIDTSNNLIKRASLSGGVTNTWSVATLHMSSARRLNCMFIMNGYIYIVNGVTSAGTNLQSTDFKAIDSDGNITGSWSSTSTTSISGACENLYASTQYNGYLYIVGPTNSYYAKQNRDGTLQSWTSTTGFSGINDTDTSFNSIAINGYIYMLGGIDTGTSATRASTGKAPINADGTVGTWSATTSLSTAVHRSNVAFLNGWLYVAGGYLNGTGEIKHIQRVRVNANGTLDAWITQSNVLTLSHHHASGGIFNGYIYLFGSNTGGANPSAVTEYAPLLADGSVGTVRATTNINVARFDGSTAALMHNGRIYISGGCSTGTGNCVNANTHIDTITYTTIKPAGELHNEAFTNDSDTFANSSYLHSTAVYNGYMYIMGGCTATDCGTITNTVRYAALNSDGSIAAFTTDGDNLPQARFGQASFSNNGYIYVVGGCSAVTTGACSTFQNTTYYSLIGASGNPAAWSTDSTNPFTTARFGHSAVTYNGFAYVMGGCSAGTCSTYLGDVQVATINSGGDLGTFAAEDSFSTTRFLHVSFAFNGYLYISGGYSGSFRSDTQYTPIASDGTISAWSTDSGDFSTARFGHGFVIDKGYAYVLGGCSALTSGRCSTYETSIQYALVNSDGTLGSWNSSQTISTGRFGNGTNIEGGNMRVSGGCTAASSGSSILSCTTINNQVQYDAINNGGPGTTKTWLVDGGGDFANARKIHGSVAYKGYLYVIGGCIVSGCSTATTNSTTLIAYAPINIDGTIGTWANTTTTFSLSRIRPMAFAYNDRMYVMGGRRYEANGQDLDDIQYSTIDSNGNITTTWTADGTDLPGGTGHFGATATTKDNTVYVTGMGTTAGSYGKVYYATMDSGSGDVSAWTETTARPLAEHRFSWLVTYRGYIYSFGGRDVSGGTNTSRVFSAPINSDNTIGTWADTSPIPFSLYTNAVNRAVVVNGYMYVIQDLGPSNIPYANFAPILTNGKLGQWQSTAQPNYGAGSSYLNFSVDQYAGNIYVTGGHITGTGCDPCTQTTYTASQSIPRVGTFSKMYDFDAGVKPTKLITRGTKQIGAVTGLNYANNNNAGAAFGTANNVADQGYGGANALNIALGTNVTLARYFFLRYNIDDSLSAVFPDIGNESTITDFDVYYDPNPGQRLRGGRTFTNGSDRGLDAAPQ